MINSGALTDGSPWLRLVAGTVAAMVFVQPSVGQGPRGEVNTPPARSERFQTSVRVGDIAPDFTLATAHGWEKVTLSSFRGQKPVVLIFGSAT